MAGSTGAARDLICDSCGGHSAPGSKACSACDSTRFAPHWVRELRRVNRNFAVQVNDPHPLSASVDPVLSLYKWWPGGHSSFNVNSVAQWDQVKRIIDTELAPHLGWATRKAVSDVLNEVDQSDATSTSKLASMVAQHPELLTRIVEGLDVANMTEEDIPELANALSAVAAVFTGIDGQLRVAISQLVKKLPAEDSKAIERLGTLMETLTLGQISAVAAEVQRRVGLLETFSERVLDDKTYEIRGDGSIHRLLEQAMWIVDERYWLMHSNKQLRTVVGDALAKKDKKSASQRPDFVCGAVDNKLIVIEIKRPSHTLEVDDLNQLEQYIAICNEYDDSHRTFEAILVGVKKSPELDRILKLRSSAFKVKTYTQLVSDARRRYKSYLDELG